MYNLQIRRNRGGDKGYGGEIVPPVPHISGDLDAKHVPSNDLYYCYHSFQVIRPSTVSDYIHSLHSLHMYICRESMDRTKIFVRQRRHTTLKMKRLNFITLLPPCLSQSLAVGCSTSFLTKENWKLGVLLSAANVNKLSVMAPGFLYVINVLTWGKYYIPTN